MLQESSSTLCLSFFELDSSILRLGVFLIELRSVDLSLAGFQLRDWLHRLGRPSVQRGLQTCQGSHFSRSMLLCQQPTVVVPRGRYVRYLLGGLWVNPFQVSGGISTLQSRASGLQSMTRGIPSGPKDSSESNQTNKKQPYN